MRIAIIAGTPQLVRAARALGVGTVFVHDSAAPPPEVEADLVLSVPLDAPGALHAALAPLHAEEPFDRVFSLTESGLLPAAEAMERLGLRGGNSAHTVRLLRDKTAMRELLNVRGLSPVAVSTPGGPADLARFCRDVAGPVILKPSGGAGSHAVVRVESADDAPAAWERFTRAAGTEPIAEEYLDGPEVSVEGFSHQGTHTIIAVTDKLTQAHFVEVGHTMPSTLPAAARSAVVELVRDFLSLINLVEGPSHTEVKLTAGGPRIIESHNRIGGDKIRELIRLAYGIELVALTAGAPLGLLEPPRTDPEPVGGAAIRFLTPPPGVVKRIELPAERPEGTKVSLDVHVGDEVVPVRRSQDRAGYVLAGGTDADDAVRSCDRLLAGVSIETG
ncbi:MAG TPA: ATP-grasp domain-containing protein [Actinospica sp.]|jgi:biotin carboxylase|nr:ATP-grasp domain-containing protein [Actinospica sp.]